MSTPISSTEELLQALKEHPEWRAKVLEALLSGSGQFLRKLLQEDPSLREELRKEILTEDLLRLPAKFEAAEGARHRDSQAVWEAIRRLTERMEGLVAAQTRTEQHLGQLTARVDQVEQQLARLTARVDQVEQQLARLTEIVSQLAENQQQINRRLERNEHRVDELLGRTLEMAIRMAPSKFLGDLVDKLEEVSVWDIKAILQAAGSVLSPEEGKQVRQLDFCFRGKRGGRWRFLAVEASNTVFPEDVNRAAQRAAIFAKAIAQNPRLSRIPVLPVVIGSSIVPEAQEIAQQKNVSVILERSD
jgi:phage shock protein A